jgi:uncharacterized phage-associated protein
MVYDAKVVANYFLDLAERDRIPLGPLKLQKIVYLAHGWSLVLRGKPLIKQNVEAWRYGPVVPALYREFKEFGASPIRRRAKVPENIELDDDTKNLLDIVWERYKSLSGVQLSAITHEPNSAWALTMRDAGPFGTSTISDELIIDEFQRRRQQK